MFALDRSPLYFTTVYKQLKKQGDKYKYKRTMYTIT